MNLLHSLLFVSLVCTAHASRHDITETHLDDLVTGLREHEEANRGTSNDQAQMLRVIPRDVPPFVQQEPYNEALALRALNYAYLSYCSHDCLHDASCKWTPDDAAFELAAVVNDDATETAAIVGFDHGDNAIVVAFRGTHNLRNWLLDLEYDKCPPDFLKNRIDLQPEEGMNPLVHCGFLEGYTKLRAGVKRAVQELLRRHVTASLLVTGHSLGGAMAEIAGLEFSQLGYPLASTQQNRLSRDGLAGKALWSPTMTRLYTFGAPRVGNEDFAEYVHTHKGLAASYRVVHRKDPIPHMPFTGWEYRHIGSEVWYTGEEGPPAELGSKTLVVESLEDAFSERVSPSRLLSDEPSYHVLCNGSGEDQECSSQVSLFTAMLHPYDHLTYFGQREKC